MSNYLYSANANPHDGFTQVTLLRDDNSIVVLERGKVYSLSASEFARLRNFIVLTPSGGSPSPPNVVEGHLFYGTFQNGDIPSWDTSIGAFVPLSGGNGGGGGSATVVDLGGNLGATKTIATAGANIVATGAILDQASCTVTITGFPAGEYRFVKITGVKGAAGDEALLIDDGSGAVAVATPEGVSAPFEVIVDWDGTDSWAYLAGGSAAPGADEAVNTVAATGATVTIPLPSVASVSDLTLNANCALTFPTADEGRSLSLILRQDATGSRTVTWPGTVKWAGGAAPTLSTAAAAIDALTFLCVDGTNWLGFVAGQAFA